MRDTVSYGNRVRGDSHGYLRNDDAVPQYTRSSVSLWIWMLGVPGVKEDTKRKLRFKNTDVTTPNSKQVDVRRASFGSVLLTGSWRLFTFRRPNPVTR